MKDEETVLVRGVPVRACWAEAIERIVSEAPPWTESQILELKQAWLEWEERKRQAEAAR